MSKNLNHLENAILENEKWVNRVLVSGTTISTIIVLLKFIEASEFEWNGVIVEIENFRFLISICVAFTAAHWYTSKLLITSVVEFWKHSTYKDRIRLLETLRATGGLLTRGFIPRERVKIKRDLYIYKFNIKDHTVWISYGSIIILLLSIIPWNSVDKSLLISLILTAGLTSIINWTIGSTWIVALTELSLQNKDEAYYLRRKIRDKKYFPKTEVIKPLFPVYYSVVNLFPFTLDNQSFPRLISIAIIVPILMPVYIILILPQILGSIIKALFRLLRGDIR